MVCASFCLVFISVVCLPKAFFLFAISPYPLSTPSPSSPQTHLDLIQLGVFVVLEILHLPFKPLTIRQSEFLLLLRPADDLFELHEALPRSFDFANDLWRRQLEDRPVGMS